MPNISVKCKVCAKCLICKKFDNCFNNKSFIFCEYSVINNREFYCNFPIDCGYNKCFEVEL